MKSVDLVFFCTVFQGTCFCVKVRLLSTKGVTTIQHLPPKAFFEKKDENIIDFIPFGIIFNYTNISKNLHISSKKTVEQRLFFTENRTNYLLLSLPVSHSAARVTTNKTEPYARKFKSPLNSSNMIFSILISECFV